MTVLISPDGTPYETTDPHEARNLQLGHGYRLAEQDDPQPTGTTKRSRRKKTTTPDDD